MIIYLLQWEYSQTLEQSTFCRWTTCNRPPVPCKQRTPDSGFTNTRCNRCCNHCTSSCSVTVVATVSKRATVQCHLLRVEVATGGSSVFGGILRVLPRNRLSVNLYRSCTILSHRYRHTEAYTDRQTDRQREVWYTRV